MPMMSNFEEVARETALILIYRELRPENRENLVRIAQGIRRAQGGNSAQDPFGRDAPTDDDDA